MQLHQSERSRPWCPRCNGTGTIQCDGTCTQPYCKMKVYPCPVCAGVDASSEPETQRASLDGTAMSESEAAAIADAIRASQDELRQ